MCRTVYFILFYFPHCNSHSFILRELCLQGWQLFHYLRGFWENVQPFILRLHFFFLLETEISSCALIPLFMPGSVHTGSVSWDDCDRVFPEELHVSFFPNRFPTLKSAHFNFAESKVHACLGVTCHLHFWQNDWGLLCATAIKWGWIKHWIRVNTQSWPWRRKFSRQSCQDSNSRPFDHESSTLTNKLS